MTTFAILLGGTIAATARLRWQVQGARVIAADSGMAHAAVLGLTPELWIGDFDSAGLALIRQYAAVPRQDFPPEKDKTDGELAVAEAMARGALSLVLVGGLGGETGHTLGLLGLALRLAREGMAVLVSSGIEEARPLLPGNALIDVPPDSLFGIVPFADLSGLDLANVKWPLHQRDVPLGSSLTLSNVAHGPVPVGLRTGYGMAILTPAPEARSPAGQS